MDVFFSSSVLLTMNGLQCEIIINNNRNEPVRVTEKGNTQIYTYVCVFQDQSKYSCIYIYILIKPHTNNAGIKKRNKQKKRERE